MKALIIGTGAAGNKSVMTVVNSNDEITKDDVILVNSTSKDIPADFDGETVILSPDDTGCGKERDIAKEFTLGAIQTGKLDLEKKVEGYDIVIVVASLEGGTGSGSAPIIAKYCDQMLGKNTHLIGFTGFEEDIRGLQNTVEFFQDIDENITVQVIQNKAFMKAAGGSKFKAEQAANRELAMRIAILDGSILQASEQNIDATDIYKVVNTKGYMTIEMEQLRGSFSDVEDFNKICSQMIYNSKSLKSTQPDQKRMGVIMNISPASEDYVDYAYAFLKEKYGTHPFECFTHKQYITDEPEYIAVISSGQRLPLDEVKEIYKRYMEESKNVNRNQDSFFSEIGSLHGMAQDNIFNMGHNKVKATTSKSDFMKQFAPKPTVVNGGSGKKE